MTKTTEFFKMSIDELLESRVPTIHDTLEEEKLAGIGKEVVYFDDMQQYRNETSEISQYVNENNYSLIAELETINGRIAIVLE